MLFVPVVPTPPGEPVTPRTRELADLLGRVIEEYEKHHPAVSSSEVQTALRLASRSSRAEGSALIRAKLALLGGVLALGGVYFFLSMDGRVDSQALPSIAVAVAIFALITAVAVARRMGR